MKLLEEKAHQFTVTRVTHGLVVPEQDHVEQIQLWDGKTNAQIKQHVQMIVGQDQLVVNAYVKMIMWRMVLINLEDNNVLKTKKALHILYCLFLTVLF